ncbi:MAG: YraN family protein [Patescibacteria group bacterium]
MTYRSEIGQFGENIACEYLIKQGYKIIERNFRQKWGEIDIIARAPDKTLVFVEVKTVQSVGQQTNVSAEDQLTGAKLQKLQRTASLYAGHNQELVNNEKGWRIDLLALTIKEGDCAVKYYENITK